MIAWLSGIVKERSEDRLVLDVNGVGYEVHVTPRTGSQVGAVGEKTELLIHTHVREDALMLYGFQGRHERELFLLLLGVSGIGPKSAMTILSALPADKLIDAIRSKNVGILQAVHGIGKKTAERLTVELADRLKKLDLPTDGKASMIEAAGGVVQDLVSALINLGYRRPDAETVASQIDFSKFPTFDTLLKQALKHLSK